MYKYFSMPTETEKAIILGSTVLGSVYLCRTALNELNRIDWDNTNILINPSIAFNAAVFGISFGVFFTYARYTIHESGIFK